MAQFLLAIDQGTTGSTVVVISDRGAVLGRGSREFPQHFPQPGWVEHDVEEIWQSVLSALSDALAAADVDPKQCAAIGITNQRETAVVWERDSGRAIHRAIVWQDRRTAARCAELETAGHLKTFRARTGLVLDPYFSGTKVQWLLQHVPQAQVRAERGELCFGTIDSFVLSRLTGGAVHLTDATNASRTLLYDIHKQAWDPELLALLDVPAAMLPEVRGCAESYGTTRGVPGLPDGIAVAGIAGDQQAALFGQTCFEVGQAKCTYGTGAFLLQNTGAVARPSEHGLVTTIAWRIGDATTYALEGSAFVAGSAVQWLRDQLGVIRASEDVEALAASVPSSDGVVFVPALTGLGAPYWDAEARGLIMGLTRGTSAAHIARATLEGVAFQIAELSFAMAQDAGAPVQRLRVDGGAANNNLLMQFQADLLDVAVDRPSSVETTALGAAYLAGLSVGMFDNLAQITEIHRVERVFEPQMAAGERHAHLARWRDAVARVTAKVGKS